LRHGLETLGRVARILRDHRLALLTQLIRCRPQGVSDAFYPPCSGVLLLVDHRARSAAHVIGGGLCLPFELAGLLFDLSGHVIFDPSGHLLGLVS
jgi:hypothetical protein